MSGAVAMTGLMSARLTRVIRRVITNEIARVQLARLYDDAREAAAAREEVLKIVSHGVNSVDATSIPVAAVPGERTILVVDGDDGVRRSTCRVLEGMGYSVISTASAEEALTTLDGSDEIPVLLVTALSLPGMGGRELADRLQASHPRLGVVSCQATRWRERRT